MDAYRVVFLIAFLLALSACGGGGSSSDSESVSDCSGQCEPVSEDPCDGATTFYARAPGDLFGIEPSGHYVLYVEDTFRGTATIAGPQAEACSLSIESHNSLIRFESAQIINNCVVKGNDNVIQYPDEMELNCKDSGLGNQIYSY